MSKPHLRRKLIRSSGRLVDALVKYSRISHEKAEAIITRGIDRTMERLTHGKNKEKS